MPLLERQFPGEEADPTVNERGHRGLLFPTGWAPKYTGTTFEMELTGTTGTANRFQHYELLRRADGTPWELGRGTMGVTFKAFDVNLRCEVALKVVNPALLHHPNARERFIREARAAARLRHRNIASVYHLGNDGDRFFYAMEFIDGETLDALVRRQGPLSAEAALRVLLQVARALAAAARQGVIHRDIKPGNLMVVQEDDDDHRVVKLIDFGLARAVTTDEEPAHLTSNGFVGTPVYTSPEQLDERPVDARSDIYSLGVTAWFLLSGRPPFNGTVASIFQQHSTKAPPWETLPVAVPASVRALLAHMLEKNPARRPQTAVELRQIIDSCRESLRAEGASSAPARTATSGSSDVQLAGRVSVLGAAVPVIPAVLPRELGPGMILKGRYELMRLVGEGNSGQVFQARDRASADEPCALKILRSDMTGETSEREILAEEVRLIQDAPHPNLIELHAFERLNSWALDFLVQEWLRGFTLMDVLAARSGTLSIGEALRILEQAASAVDHAAERNLERLDLALHQLHIDFPGRAAGSGNDTALREFMAKPLTAWPRWTLKINPLGAIHGELDSSTWAGEVTILPGATPSLDRDLNLAESSDILATSYLRGLARTVYEMLGGAPVKSDAAEDQPVKYVSLPTLSEEANAVLQRVLLDEHPPYRSGQALYAALSAATGVRATSPLDERPDRLASVAAPRSGPLQGAGDRIVHTLFPEGVTSPAAVDFEHESPAELPGLEIPAAERESFASKTSVWDRLALVSETGHRYRSWLPTAAVTGLLVIAFASVAVVAVTHRKPRTKPTNTSAVAVAPNSPITSPTRTPVPTPRVSVSVPPDDPRPAMISRSSSVDSPARNAPATPSPVVASSPAVELAPTTPPPLSPTPAPRDNVVKVRIETKPAGAEIRMAGKLLGTTPLEISLSPGDHQLVARYRNWPEVRHTLHLDADQLTALDEIHMIPPTLVPTAEASPSPSNRAHRPTPGTTRRDGSRSSPIPSGNSIVHFPSPTPIPSSSSRSKEPFLPSSTPVRRPKPVLTPFSPDGALQQKPRRREPEPLQSTSESDD